MASPSRFFMPAENAPHLRTLTAWPDVDSLKTAADLAGAEADVAAISNAIVKFEPVTLICRSRNVTRARKLLSPAVEILQINSNELWIRDTGPVYVHDVRGDQVGLDFNFNYWGDKYKGEFDRDVARSVLQAQSVKRVQVPFVAEGGAIEVDGEGTLLITASSVVNDNRNKGQTREDLERHFKEFLGIQKVIWFRGMKDKDITDWHIDAMARFVAPAKILLSRPTKLADPDAQEVYENAKHVLETQSDAKGRRIEILEVEEADPRLFPGDDPYQLVLSYLNYLLVNGGVIIPTFGDRIADDNALSMFQQCFPGRRIEQVKLDTLRRMGGGIHCSTQQQPSPGTTRG